MKIPSRVMSVWQLTWHSDEKLYCVYDRQDIYQTWLWVARRVSYRKQELPFTVSWVHPRVLWWSSCCSYVYFSLLCWFLFLSSSCVFCVHHCMCLSISNSWLPFWFSLTFILKVGQSLKLVFTACLIIIQYWKS